MYPLLSTFGYTLNKDKQAFKKQKKTPKVG